MTRSPAVKLALLAALTAVGLVSTSVVALAAPTIGPPRPPACAKDTTPTFVGGGAVFPSLDPVVLRIEQAPTGTLVQDIPAGGVPPAWTATAAPLADGPYRAIVRQGVPGDDHRFRVDNAPPAGLSVTQPAPVTAAAVPTLGGGKGNAPCDENDVWVYFNRLEEGTGPPVVPGAYPFPIGNALNSWSGPSPRALTPGKYSLRATQKDNAVPGGNASFTGWWNFSVVAAGFTFSPESAPTGDPITFTSTTPDLPGIAYAWSLDPDGAYDDGDGPSVTRTFSTPGARTVRLKITTPDGTSSIAERSVSPGNQPPTASFSAFPSAPVVGETVNLVSTSSDPDGPLASQAWDLNGDGNYDDATGGQVARSFASPGVYTVGLEVIDAGAIARRAFADVTVAPKPSSSSPPPTVERKRLLSPFPVVRIAGQLRRNGVKVTLLSVKAPKGAKVSVKCKGPGCPKKVPAITAVKTATIKLKRMHRTLGAKAQVEVFVTGKNRIGKYTKFTVRRGKSPKRSDRCLPVDGTTPITCPDAD